MHYDNFNPTAALKHSFSMKIHAKQKYQSLKLKDHKRPKFENVGLVILNKHLFIRALPDCLVTCKCYGDCLLDVKSPRNIRHEKSQA